MSFCPHSFITKNFKNSFIKTVLSSFMADEKLSRNQAYVLLNVDYKHQKNIINKAESLSTVQNVKTMYGIYDLMIILESDDMGAIEIIIVGAGPAGLSAGIYVARQNVSCLVISKDLGGQMNLIPRLENYPGAIMSSGQILAKTLETQYLSFKGEIVYDTVEKIDESEGGFKIKTTRSEYKAKAIVLAPGKVPNMLGLENESQYFNKGIHYCTKCDAPFYQGRTTASIGVGSYLLESGLLLSRMASKMYLILKGSKLAGDKDLVATLENNKNIEIVTQSSVKAVSGNSVLQQITIVDSSGAEKILDVQANYCCMWRWF